jgi:hypothetical protein
MEKAQGNIECVSKSAELAPGSLSLSFFPGYYFLVLGISLFYFY